MGTRRRDVAGVVVSAASVQVGAAIGATAFPLVGPAGVAALRQAVAAVVLLAVVRPPVRSFGLRALAPAALLGVATVVMNVALYAAVQRIGLGLAVTVEFCGPLAVSLAASHRRHDVACGLLALTGVAVLAGAFGGSVVDPVGVLLALLAAVAWGAYILFNQRAGRALPGVSGVALASGVASLITLPVLVVELVTLPVGALPGVLLVGLATGVLSNAFPYSLDTLLLRRLPRALFGMLQSVHPLAAAAFGLLVLGQALAPSQVCGVLAVCVANAVAVGLTPRPPALPVEP